MDCSSVGISFYLQMNICETKALLLLLLVNHVYIYIYTSSRSNPLHTPPCFLFLINQPNLRCHPYHPYAPPAPNSFRSSAALAAGVAVSLAVGIAVALGVVGTVAVAAALEGVEGRGVYAWWVIVSHDSQHMNVRYETSH